MRLMAESFGVAWLNPVHLDLLDMGLLPISRFAVCRTVSVGATQTASISLTPRSLLSVDQVRCRPSSELKRTEQAK